MPRIATTGIAPWQTALKCTVLRIAKFRAQVARNTCCQVKPVAIRTQIHTSVCGNPRDGYSIRGNPQSKRRRLP
jgi:hypothetical protein